MALDVAGDSSRCQPIMCVWGVNWVGFEKLKETAHTFQATTHTFLQLYPHTSTATVQVRLHSEAASQLQQQLDAAVATAREAEGRNELVLQQARGAEGGYSRPRARGAEAGGGL